MVVDSVDSKFVYTFVILLLILTKMDIYIFFSSPKSGFICIYLISILAFSTNPNYPNKC